MADLKPINKAAQLAGVNRNAVARWVKLGLLKGTPEQKGHLVATLVSVSEVRKLAKIRKPGRPRKDK